MGEFDFTYHQDPIKFSFILSDVVKMELNADEDRIEEVVSF